MKNASERRGGWHLFLSVVATDLATEHGGTDAIRRDAVRQRERLNFAHVQL